MKTALITGATSGIGYELARLFAKDNYNLVLIARNKENLEKTAQELKTSYNIQIKAIAKDLSNPKSPEEIYKELKKESINIDVLVNNAGAANFGLFHDNDIKKELDIIQLNLTSLTHLTHLFLKDMLERKSGKVLNVSSSAGFQPGPLMAVYYASKAYVTSFSQALSKELEHAGITVTALCPGVTATNFQRNADMENSSLFSGSIMSAEDVALQGYTALMKGKPLVVPGIKYKLLSQLIRFLPRRLVVNTVKKMHEPK